ncbi:MAG: hypothetical protein GY816_05885 [Cytophagales bacterium]|nr:hypothetical protein [Cytophagales bacterium]
MKNTLALVGALLPLLSFSQSIFINEIHYDNASSDVNEGIEIAGPTGTDLSTYTLELYNGNGGTVYNTVALSGIISDQQNGFGTLFFSISGLQNGSPDGAALVDGSNAVVQFLSYEGSITGVGGSADGLLSEDLGVAESSSTPVGLSLQLIGDGTEYTDFTWAPESTSSYNAVNTGQTLGTSEPTVFINEIHYDNASSDVNEGVEVAGTAGTDLVGWTLYLYNGSNGTVYNTVNLSGTISDQDSGFGTLSFAISGMQNGSPDGIVLANPDDSVIQFLSYEGSLTGVGGVADGLLSEDIGISETSSTPVDFSLQLTSSGQSFDDFTWTADTHTFGAVNVNQSFGNIPPPDPDPVVGNVFINEIHYDNASSDVGEGIEVAGPAGVDLTDWSLVLYNGNGGAAYNTVNLTGIIPDQQAGSGTVFFAISGVQNGSPDGIALVAPEDSLIQFLSYEGSFTGVGAAADGILSEDIGVVEISSTAVGSSLQLEGSGSIYSDFTWAAPEVSTYNQINNNQIFEAPTQNVFVNEIHYDNASSDTGEGIEIAGNAGIDLTGWSLFLYNGNGGAVYNTVPLSGIIPDQDNGYGTVSFSISGIQNGGPDGVALTAPGDSLIQFLSYEGTFAGVGGPADGVLSEDIGESESSSTPAGFSLQLEGVGQAYTDFTWGAAQTHTFGLININQSFGDSIIVVPTSDTVTVAQARLLPLNSDVIVRAVLTATDQFGGPSYLQDSTAGIALFDLAVHGDGMFNIGDQVWITASVGQFNSQLQLVNVDTVVLVNTGVAVAPILTTLDQISSFEGQLVTINGISFDVPSGLLFPNTNYNIGDGTGTQQVRIDGNVDLVGRNRPEITTSITGVVGRFQTSVQLLPRFIPDLPGTTPYVPGGSEIPFEQTFDIATWNMEFFGTTISGFGSSDISLQASNANIVLAALNADIIAVQEVSSDSLLLVIVDGLSGYELICSDVYSRSWQAPDPSNPFPPQKLCFIYNTATVNLVSERAVFDDFYTQARLGLIPDLDGYPTSSGASSFWSSGRLPYQMIADVTTLGSTRRVNLINIHAKSGSGSNDLARREFDNMVLKDTLDAQYAGDNIILLGDYNDDVFTSIGGGASTYAVILNDSANYDAITASLSLSETPTFIGGSGSTIDHMTISNELFGDWIPGTESIYFPFNDVDNYEGTTSDHLPVLARFDIIPPVELSITGEQTVYLGYAPEKSATFEVTPTGGTTPYSFAWSSGETTASIVVSPQATGYFSVVVTDANGEQAQDSTLVNVIDVSCGNGKGQPKVEICYKGKTKCIAFPAVASLLKNGATLGACNVTAEVANIESAVAYPNPMQNKLTVSLITQADTDLVLTVRALFTGKAVRTEHARLKAGDNELAMDLSSLESGFYLLILTNIESGEVEKTVKLFKQ